MKTVLIIVVLKFSNLSLGCVFYNYLRKLDLCLFVLGPRIPYDGFSLCWNFDLLYVHHRGYSSKIDFRNPKCCFFSRPATIQKIFFTDLLALKNL